MNEKQWKQKKQKMITRAKRKQEKREILDKGHKLSMSKWLILFLFISCAAIEVFTGYATIQMIILSEVTGLLDFSPLITLIGTVVGEVIGYAVYSIKALKENTAGGLVYDKAMAEMAANDEDPIDEEIDEDAEG